MYFVPLYKDFEVNYRTSIVVIIFSRFKRHFNFLDRMNVIFSSQNGRGQLRILDEAKMGKPSLTMSCSDNVTPYYSMSSKCLLINHNIIAKGTLVVHHAYPNWSLATTRDSTRE